MAPRTPLKDHLRETHLFTSRALVALVMVGLLLVVVVARLIYLQIISHEHFSTLSENNRVNIVPMPPTRGLIYDRNGVLLAQNLPAFSLEVIPEQVKNLDQTLAALAQLIAIDEDNLDQFKKRLDQRHPFEAIPLRLRLSEEEVARFAVNRHRFPGVDVGARLTRDYPLGELAVHAVGYAGRINEADLKVLDVSNYRGTTHTGKTGVEKYYEDILHGQVGYQHEETNAVGRVLRVLERRLPTPGQNLYLSLDVDLQMVAELALTGKRGAVVAINPKNGEVLVAASLPGYDPGSFVNGISTRDYDTLRQSLDQPLFNRIVTGQYPPGSTIKPLVALAGLEYKEITPHTDTFCPGWFSLPGDSHRYRDWKKEGHGSVDVRLAIMRSCDVYFYDLARTLGIDRMQKYLGYFGLGRRTEIDLPGEVAGLLPSRDWKRAARNQAWFPGETLITGIGQGFLLTTPMQLAAATAMLASRGEVWRPHLLHAVQPTSTSRLLVQPPVQIGKVPVSDAANWDTVISAMEGVVHDPDGTAKGINRGITYHMAGKTGTAQVFGIKQGEKYKASELAERLHDHALFVAFAPVENPEIAVVVVVENGGSGSGEAAPVARAVMDRYFVNKPGS